MTLFKTWNVNSDIEPSLRYNRALHCTWLTPQPVNTLELLCCLTKFK